MKLLFLTPYLPSPPTFGGQRRLHGLMGALARRHDVSILSLHNPVDPYDDWLAQTRAQYGDVTALVNPLFGLKGRDKRLAQLRSLASTRSWDAISHRHEPLTQALRERLERGSFDALVVEFAQMAVNLEGVRLPPRLKLVLDEHNVEFDLQRRTARSAESLVRRVFQEANWRKLEREEVAAWRRFDGVSATSARDLEHVQAHAPRVPRALVPNGVDLQTFAPPAQPPEDDTVVFFGAHNYFPNADGLTFLFEQIWPKVRALRPSARLRVVGPPPDDSVRRLAPPGVQIEGFVKDVAAEVGRAAVAIAPLRIGGGTRLKVVEAMALARPVVATRIGAEGLEVEDGRDLLLVDDPRAYAEAIARLLANPAEARALGLRGRQRAEAAYGWDASAQKFERLLEQVVRA
ncbi:MAG: glycosyltransferase [Deltaproteobacteria bacterium]|nr:glycosyltransferase [Deltaproteobacteria bacterium]